MSFGLHDKDWIDPPDEPDPPEWWEAYEVACIVMDVEPTELEWTDDGRSNAIAELEEIKCAVDAALEVM